MSQSIQLTRDRLVFDDLRGFMDHLRERRLLHEIEAPVEKDWEVGTVCRETFDRGGPALVFRHVGAYQTPLVVGVVATTDRYAAAMGVAADIDQIAQVWDRAYAQPIKPRLVGRDEAPCKQVTREEIDLYADPFPVPVWHPLDAGPELGTLHGVITRDPDTGWLNCGTYRNQILARDKLGCLVIPYRHIGLHWHKWKERRQPMPVAIAIGLDPLLTLTSVSAVPSGVDEYDITGGLRGRPLEVVKAELSDLLVPAHAEIIIEGEMSTDSFWPEEAPFGEFPGYMGTQVKNSHFIDVKLVTHRQNPYFQGTYEGRPPNESTTVRSIGRSMAMYEHLKRAGIPGIVDVCVTPGGTAGLHCVVSIEKRYPGHVRDVMGHVWGHPNLFCKHCTVVDEDVNPWDPVRVEWAVATRVQADRDIEIVRHGKSIVLDPSQVPSRRGWSSLLGIDATKPIEWYAADGAAFPAGTDPLPEWSERVRLQWGKYAIPEGQPQMVLPSRRARGSTPSLPAGTEREGPAQM